MERLIDGQCPLDVGMAKIINTLLTTKQLQRLAYLNGTAVEPKFGFYAGCQAPNGTHDLIITDRDGTIVACIDEALFGVPYNKFKSQYASFNYCDGESVFNISAKDIDESDDCNIVGYIGDDTTIDWERYIAVSPVQSKADVQARVMQCLE